MSHTLGHAEWIRAAVDRYESPLRRYAHRMLGDAEAARDVVQETFLRLCGARPELVNGHLGPWLFAVCRNQAHSARRKESRMMTLTDAVETQLESPHDSPAAAAERSESEHRLLDLLAELPRNQQTVIRLKFQHGFRYKQIAETTGLSVSNVGFLIHRGMKTLRERMPEE